VPNAARRSNLLYNLQARHLSCTQPNMEHQPLSHAYWNLAQKLQLVYALGVVSPSFKLKLLMVHTCFFFMCNHKVRILLKY
jgi:hypothetical protein